MFSAVSYCILIRVFSICPRVKMRCPLGDNAFRAEVSYFFVNEGLGLDKTLYSLTLSLNAPAKYTDGLVKRCKKMSILT